MRSSFPALIIAIAALPSLPAEQGSGPVGRSAPPSWVLPHPQVAPSVEPSDGAYRYHVVDFQHHLECEQRYEHYVVSLLTESGVKEFAQLNFDFQPEFETLHLHHVSIKRGGRVHDRLANARIETLRREQGMDQQLYDGQLTALIILEDIRPGDLLSYSLTRTGANPVHQGHVHRSLRLGFSVPIDYLRRRLVWDGAARPLAWQIVGPTVKAPNLGRWEDFDELIWEMPGSLPRTVESNTPGRHFDHPWLEYSDFRDWSGFAEWALGIYAEDQPMPAELVQVCDEIDRSAASDEEKIVTSLRWVQRNIRYLGSFFGEHTHAPYPLAEICRRRFGDCKDSAVMTVAMLRHLGFDAAPALVSTLRRSAVASYLPGYNCFDHLIVHLRWQDKDYFLDPTHTYQRGPLDQLHTPDYGFAFVVRPGHDELSRVQPRGHEVSRTVITETYTVPAKVGGAELRVRTVATGGDANGLRAGMAEDPVAEHEKSYLGFYARDFPGIEVASPLEFHDDEAKNQVTLEEHYRIPVFWAESESDPNWSAWVRARYLETTLSFPEKETREHPWAHAHPRQIQQVIEVKLPEEWAVEPSQVEVDQPAFRYRSDLVRLAKGFRVEYHYVSLADEVKAAEFESFRDAMQRIPDDLSVQVYHSDRAVAAATAPPAASAFGWALLGGAGSLGLVLGIVAAILVWFWDPAPRAAAANAPSGLGGWLVLPIIGCFLSLPAHLATGLSYFTNLSEMAPILDAETGFAGWRLYYFLGVFFAVFAIPPSFVALVLLFRRRVSFPFFFIGLLLLDLGVSVVLAAVEGGLADVDQSGGPTVGRVVGLLLWGTYMIRSERVKATFTRRRRASGPAPVVHPEPVGLAS